MRHFKQTDHDNKENILRNWKIIFVIFLTFLISSCSTLNLATRKGKDLQLISSDFEKFNGTYLNISTDTNNLRLPLYCNFTKGKQSKDTLCRRKQYDVKVLSDGPKNLTLELNDNGITIQKVTLKGKYKNGYFKVKRQLVFKWAFGPLVWVFEEHINCIGLSKNNNLVVLDSGGVGVLFIVAIPIFVAGGDKQDNEYIRTK
jgi:hypothetical protein